MQLKTIKHTKHNVTTVWSPFKTAGQEAQMPQYS